MHISYGLTKLACLILDCYFKIKQFCITRQLRFCLSCTIILTILCGCAQSLGDKLIAASGNGDVNEIKELLKSGAHVNYRCHSLDSGTPLIWAVRGRHEEAVTVLIDAGADPNIRCGTGETALFFAIGNSADDVSPILIKKLILAGANTEINRELFENLSVNDTNRIAYEQAIALKNKFKVNSTSQP